MHPNKPHCPLPLSYLSEGCLCVCMHSRVRSDGEAICFSGRAWRLAHLAWHGMGIEESRGEHTVRLLSCFDDTFLFFGLWFPFFFGFPLAIFGISGSLALFESMGRPIPPTLFAFLGLFDLLSVG